MTNPDYTHLLVIADRSGSMARIAGDMNGGLDTFLTEQSKLPGKLLIDIVTFDHAVEEVATDATVDQITFPIIVPRGSTALHDAIGRSVVSLGEKLARLDEAERPGKVIVMIVTDGHENASREFSGKEGADRIKEMVERQRAEYQWEFMFLGANIDSFGVAGAFGIPAGATIDYAAGAEGTQSVLRAASVYATSTRSGLAANFSEADRQAAAQK